MRTLQIPRPIRLLTQLGADALKSSLVNGRYFGPLVSKRRAADLRKRAIIDGTFGNFVANEGGWDPNWDNARKTIMLKPPRGHIRERTREARAAKIDAAMKAMPERLNKIKQEKGDKIIKNDIFSLFRSVALMSKHINENSKAQAQPPAKKKK